MPSKALRGKLSFEVYLPPGYAGSGKRYPAIYFLHGLPASPYTFRGMTAFEAALDKTGGRAILVLPQGARDGDSDPEYLDWGTGRNWETAIGKELPRYVDRHFRTIANRRGRALVGLSAGGYGAVLLALHHLGDYSVMESWSGYFHSTNQVAPWRSIWAQRPRTGGRARTASSARSGGVPAQAHVLRVLRRPGRREVPRRESTPAPGTRRRGGAARVRALPRRPRADALEPPRRDLAQARAAAPRARTRVNLTS